MFNFFSTVLVLCDNDGEITILVPCGTDEGETTFEFGFATTEIKIAEIIKQNHTTHILRKK